MLQCLAWLAVVISFRRGRQRLYWLVLATWHLQPIALALAILPKAVAGHVAAHDIPLAVALGLELAFLAAEDWQRARQHARSLQGDSLQEGLLHGESLAPTAARQTSPSSLLHYSTAGRDQPASAKYSRPSLSASCLGLCIELCRREATCEVTFTVQTVLCKRVNGTCWSYR